MICPNCGFMNRPAAHFCGRCGKRFEEQTLASVTMGEGVPPEAQDVAAPESTAGMAETSSPALPPEAAVASEAQPELSAVEKEDRVAPAMAAADGETVGVTEHSAAAPITGDEELALGQPAPAFPAPSGTESTLQEPGRAIGAPLTPLAAGTRLLERYTIVSTVSAGEDVNVYRVVDARRCSGCGAENEPEDEYCANCGRQLGEPARILLEERADITDQPPSLPAFVENGRVYQPKLEAPADSAPLSARVRLHFGVKSDVGLVRGRTGEPNEDSTAAMALTASSQSSGRGAAGLFIVADGVGGSEAGEMASRRCIRIVMDAIWREVMVPWLGDELPSEEKVRAEIQAAIQGADKAIREQAEQNHTDMGTTITLALILDGRAFVANVGDSRTYLFDGRLRQITEDHSFVASLIAAGMAKPEEVYTHPQRNIIFRSLGARSSSSEHLLDVDVFPKEGGALELQPGMRLLLCSDGLWEMVRDGAIEDAFFEENDPQKLCARLVEQANLNGGADNVSAIVVSIAGD